ncbi:MAG: radical SAM protein [Betaproteobacteria bacterium]|nr:MAG: radical SAM protein [Betaproteobacteria bacterium]
MNICLATVHAKPAFTPLALLYLKAHLVAQGTLADEAVLILEFNPSDAPGEIVRKVLQSEPAIVGLSCYLWNVTTLLAAARLIKNLQPDIRIVLGGPEVGPEARSVLERNPWVDCIVKSEGELVFNQVLDTWKRRGDLALVKGICYRREHEVLETENAGLVQDLNQLASPLQVFRSDPTGRIACVETQRGCVFSCNFCFEGKNLSIRNRRFDLDRVKDEILFWLQRDVSWIYLMDPVFNLNAARAKEICRFLAEHNRKRIPVHAEVWAEFIDEEMAQLMHAAQFQFLEVGLQTTDENVLVTVERRLKLKRFLEGIDHLKRQTIPFQVQLIYGLPGETKASFRTSLNFAASLQAPDLAVFPLMVLPGTELRVKAAKLKIDYDPEPPYLIRSHCSMDAADIAYGLRVAETVNGVGRLWTIRLLAREPGVTLADVIDAWVDWTNGESAGGASRDAAPEAEALRRFILHFCALRRIPPEFYEASSAVEQGALMRIEAVPI